MAINTGVSTYKKSGLAGGFSLCGPFTTEDTLTASPHPTLGAVADFNLETSTTFH